VLADFATGFVNRAQGGAGEFELTARLQRDALAVLRHGDDLAVLLDGLPAIADETLEQRADAIGRIIADAAQRLQVIDELLVLGADAPIRLGLVAFGDVVDELALCRHRLAARFGRC
jgi:hypothetical protein